MKKILKKIYNIIPFKHQLFSALKTFWTPDEKIYRHLHFKGIIKIALGNAKSFKANHYGYQLENEIFWAGITNGWEKESIKLWMKLCSKSSVIFDIGANTGIYSLVAKTINPENKVYAFEPMRRVFEKLKENIALNNFDIIPIEKAVSDKDGTAMLYPTNTEFEYTVAVNKNLFSAETKVIPTQIETVTLNSFIRENNIPKIDLMKIDVETHEPEVLKGFSDYLYLYKPTLLIEILNDEIGEKVNEIVQNIGYTFFNIDERGKIRKADKITKSDFYNYLLCNQETAKELGLVF